MIALGGVYQVAVDVRDAAGALVTPANMTLTITLPDGTTVTPDVPAPDEAGKVRVDYVTTSPGRHVWRLTTATPTTAYADIFEVLPADAGQIVSLADAKAHLNIPAANRGDDEELRDFVLAATAVVERYVGAVARREHVESFDGGRPDLILSHAPVLAVASVLEDGAAVTASGYVLDAVSGVLRRTLAGTAACWRGGVGGVQVTYTAGRTQVPANVSRAALIITKHMWETQRGGGSSRPALVDDDTVALQPGGAGYAIPYRALELLGEPVPGIA